MLNYLLLKAKKVCQYFFVSTIQLYISYINRFGEVQYPKLNYIARKIWMYCEEHGHYVYAAYINTRDNFVADAESQSQEYNSEWTIDDSCFHRIIRHFNYHPSIDLFASHSNQKLNLYVSWRPDPFAYEVDAFFLFWKNWKLYCFSPFSLIARVLQKMRNENVQGIIVVPYCPAQPWWPLCIQLSQGRMLKLTFNEHLLHFNRELHPMRHSLILVASLLFANLS